MKDDADKKPEEVSPSPTPPPSTAGSDSDNVNAIVNAHANGEDTSPTSPFRNEHLDALNKANNNNDSDDSVDGSGAIPLPTQPELLPPSFSSRSYSSDSELSTLSATPSLDSDNDIDCNNHNNKSNCNNSSNTIQNEVAEESITMRLRYCPTKYTDEDVARIVGRRTFLPTPASPTPASPTPEPETKTSYVRGTQEPQEPQDEHDGAKDSFPEPRPDEVYLFVYGRYFDKFFLHKMLPDAKQLGLAQVSGYRWLLCGPRREGEFFFFFHPFLFFSPTFLFHVINYTILPIVVWPPFFISASLIFLRKMKPTTNLHDTYLFIYLFFSLFPIVTSSYPHTFIMPSYSYTLTPLSTPSPSNPYSI